MTGEYIDPRPWIDLSDQVAVVTGGGAGIGRAAAIALASAGSVVIVTDTNMSGAENTVATIVSGGGSAYSLKLDVISQSEWDEAADWIEREFGHLDILVNCAGVALSDRVGDDSLDVYRKTFAINTEGSLLGMAMALRFMRKTGKGSIINLSSGAAKRGNPIMASYGASKAAVAHFTRSAAVETMRSGHDIRINAILPGLIETSMADDLYKIQEKLGPPETIIEKMTTGRTGQPKEVADLILFLASDRASYISGTSINIDRAVSA